MDKSDAWEMGACVVCVTQSIAHPLSPSPHCWLHHRKKGDVVHQANVVLAVVPDIKLHRWLRPGSTPGPRLGLGWCWCWRCFAVMEDAMNWGRQSSRQASLHSINQVVVGGSSQRTGADSQMQGMAPRPGRFPFPLREHFPIFFFPLSSLVLSPRIPLYCPC